MKPMENPNLGPLGLVTGWFFGIVGTFNAGIIPLILSSIATSMAIVNYYYQIKKHKNENKP